MQEDKEALFDVIDTIKMQIEFVKTKIEVFYEPISSINHQKNLDK